MRLRTLVVATLIAIPALVQAVPLQAPPFQPGEPTVPPGPPPGLMVPVGPPDFAGGPPFEPGPPPGVPPQPDVPPGPPFPTPPGSPPPFQSQVPEPGTALLLVGGLAGLAGLGRRRS